MIARRTGQTVRISIAGFATEDHPSGANVPPSWEVTLAGTPTLTTNVLAIGSQIRTGEDSSVRLTGEVAEVLIFDRALSEDEYLAALDDGFPVAGVLPASVNPADLLAYYPLDAANGVADLSGNGRDLTLTGTVTFDDSPELYITREDLPSPTAMLPLIVQNPNSTGEVFEVALRTDRQGMLSPLWQISNPPVNIRCRSYGYIIGNTTTDAQFLANQDSDFAPQPRICLLYTSPSPRDQRGSRMPSSA